MSRGRQPPFPRVDEEPVGTQEQEDGAGPAASDDESVSLAPPTAPTSAPRGTPIVPQLGRLVSPDPDGRQRRVWGDAGEGSTSGGSAEDPDGSEHDDGGFERDMYPARDRSSPGSPRSGSLSSRAGAYPAQDSSRL